MAVDRRGTHITHCCAYHGCKYSYSGDECPVVDENVPQAYACEECWVAMEEYPIEIERMQKELEFAERFRKEKE